MKKTIHIPTRLNTVSAVENIGLDKLDLAKADELDISFSDCRYAEPLPLIYLQQKFRHLVKKFPHLKIRMLSRDTPFRGYAEHIGFFNFLGFPRGKAPGSARGNSNYTPITIYKIRDLQREAGTSPIGRLVLDKASDLARILCQKDKGDLFDLFEYSFREIMRNAAEHSRGSRLVVLGQYWPTTQKAEIVIADDGIGIATNLYDIEYVECETNLEALKCAMLPGISGVSLEERIGQDEKWGNSGFGLYTTSRICSEAGAFRIISGNDGLTLSKGRQFEHPWSYRGTCVQMVFNVSNASRMIERINEIITEGEEEKSEILSRFPIKASAASKMLASHFQKDDELI
ncbi:MAG: hypothetical protein EP320_12835 [Rhodobacteraceae bacterium]|nr:MAG: hypothetical protein EP320_12835 [Paracoccaceae bacterium]